VQYAGYLAYGRLEGLLGNEEAAREFLKRANDVNVFESGVVGQGLSKLLLVFRTGSQTEEAWIKSIGSYYGAAEEGPKSESVVNAILRSIGDKEPIGIEEQSHLPEILYRYGKPDPAYEQILDLTAEWKNRREYPEVSYGWSARLLPG